ncbi:hypothetical protein D9M68_763180 [compost metagenome]
MPAPLGNRQPGQLADRREIIRLDELHRCQFGVERAILATDRQVAFGKIQVDYFTGVARCGAEADTAGVGEQVEHAFAGAVCLDPAAGVAQVEKQQRILPCMAAAHAVLDTPFMADQVLKGIGVGLVNRVAAIDP